MVLKPIEKLGGHHGVTVSGLVLLCERLGNFDDMTQM